MNEKSPPEMQKAPVFPEAHAISLGVAITSGLITTAAACYHIYDAATFSHTAVKWLFVGLAGIFTFGLSMTPIAIARAHGSAIEGGNPQSALLIIVLMIMALDGAMQVHAVTVIVNSFGAKPLNIWWLAIGAALFQLAMYFLRSALYAASAEIQEMIDAREHEARMAASNIRASLEAKATELKIPFDGRTTDNALRAKINQSQLHAVA
jgi:hypothetical protein